MAKNSLKDIVEEGLRSPGFNLVATVFDYVILAGSPVAGLSLGALQTLSDLKTRRDQFLLSKMIEACSVLQEQMQKQNITPMQMQVTISNLRKEHGEDYFNDANFASIEQADSRKRAGYLGYLLAAAAKFDDTRDRYFDIMNAIRSLPIRDIESLREINDEILKMEKVRSYSYVAVPGVQSWKSPEEISKKYGYDRLLRYQSVGLTRYNDFLDQQYIPLLDASYTQMVLRSIGI